MVKQIECMPWPTNQKEALKLPFFYIHVQIRSYSLPSSARILIYLPVDNQVFYILPLKVEKRMALALPVLRMERLAGSNINFLSQLSQRNLPAGHHYIQIYYNDIFGSSFLNSKFLFFLQT